LGEYRRFGMILLIDNYDSFSYNLYQLIGEIQQDIRVVRNDDITISDIEQMQPTHIIISPGPGKPSDAGICEEAIKHFAGQIPMLGVCLGHQAICEAFGGTVGHASRLMHGKQSDTELDTASALFAGLEKEVKVARYHSLSLQEDTLPDCLEIISKARDDREVMAVKHKDYNVYGLQFHPESILTPDGLTIIENFMEKVERGIL
jgi:anthranilate synthase component 2